MSTFHLRFTAWVLAGLSGLFAPKTLGNGDDYFRNRLCIHPPTATSMVTSLEPSVRYWTHFNPLNWSGELSKERLAAATPGTTLWRASEHVPRPGRLLLAGSHGQSALKDFRWSALNEEERAVLNRGADGEPDGYGAARVALLSGESCEGLDGCPLLRPGLPKLGDIINSVPLLVGSPDRIAKVMDTYDGSPGAYAAFKTKPRRAQVYVGANDGRLHAFDAATGEERWSVVPSALLPKLVTLTAATYGSHHGDPHRFFVDGPLLSQDVYYDGAWHTVLLVSFGAGGRGLLALDVSDPDRPVHLWEYSASNDPHLGHVLTAPTIARLHTGQWAAVLGNGVDVPTDTAALLLLDIRTGALIRRIVTPRPAPGLAMPRVVDTNGDGNADYAYAGDNLGNLWRFDLFDTSVGGLDKPAPPHAVSPDNFRLAFAGTPLFSAPTRTSASAAQPITMAPSVVSHPSEQGYLILFGTGQNHLSPDVDQHSLYAVWDRQTQGEKTAAADAVRFESLQEQQISPPLRLTNHAVSWQLPDAATGDKHGWYIDLQPGTAGAGSERLTDPPEKHGELLFVRTRIPSIAPCQRDVERRLYAINSGTGSGTLFPVFDLNHDGRVDEQDTREGDLPSGINVDENVHIVVDPGTGAPCVLGNNGCASISLGPRANGRQSWRVITDVTP